ncbi:MAG TPA: VOC family protein [Burkholderiales bacterium]|jgi:catechol 2,3-dioxygenase-like lactoylglutathione lyase family enzyme
MSFSLAFTHVGIHVTDMDRMVDFYTRVVGFAVSDRGPRLSGGGEIAFMTRDPREHHQLVLATGRPANLPFNMVNQLSFLVDGLPTLQTLYRDIKREPGVEDLGPVSHGNALSAYFFDPEKNRIEFYLHTPWHVPQPHRISVDLSLPAAQLWAAVEQDVRATPGFKPREQWIAEMERKVAQATARRGTARATERA